MDNHRYSIEEVEDILEDIANTIPLELYRNLNGGIVLIESEKIHPKAVTNDLYIAGEYIRHRMYKYIKIYYGSVIKIHGNLSRDRFIEKLREILIHEFRHHIEYESGDYSLVLEDKIFLKNYLERHNK